MAIASPSPAVEANDLVTLKAAVAFMSQTGHPVSLTNLNRWIDRYGIPVTRRGRRNWVSMSAVLRAERDEMDRMAAG
ncbi:hypothetical protein [Streptomyces sioyaensis]|uniref:hypothetical protein n=1 Tax=Streptomyces sioyaensis TaxID=67364 RepID=UPI003790C190